MTLLRQSTLDAQARSPCPGCTRGRCGGGLRQRRRGRSIPRFPRCNTRCRRLRGHACRPSYHAGLPASRRGYPAQRGHGSPFRSVPGAGVKILPAPAPEKPAADWCRRQTAAAVPSGCVPGAFPAAGRCISVRRCCRSARRHTLLPALSSRAAAGRRSGRWPRRRLPAPRFPHPAPPFVENIAGLSRPGPPAGGRCRHRG